MSRATRHTGLVAFLLLLLCTVLAVSSAAGRETSRPAQAIAKVAGWEAPGASSATGIGWD
ncbi:hypothetical protein [Streptomyces sp. NPDC003077]|uniref:hypothetical protein n=1 Tax=Streptomyces sp. NPDC003077 TaxID=3154443 RepID=UPI0033A4891A